MHWHFQEAPVADRVRARPRPVTGPDTLLWPPHPLARPTPPLSHWGTPYVCHSLGLGSPRSPRETELQLPAWPERTRHAGSGSASPAPPAPLRPHLDEGVGAIEAGQG